MSKISKAAVDLIFEGEVTNKAYYDKHYQHFDWPKGASGPTVGVGYDCGYCKPDEIRKDWFGIVDDDTINVLVSASGIKGREAGTWVKAHKGDVTIPFSAARRQFDEREMPKWIDRVEAQLPNTDKLSPDSLGALVSIAYNRGLFGGEGDRRREMRQIKQYMEDEQFDLIPDAIRAMKRLWSPSSGLVRRRDREANLFLRGLNAEAPARTSHDRPDADMPKSSDEPQAKPSPVPSRPVAAARSRSVWAIVMSGFLWVLNTFEDAIRWIAEALHGVSGEVSENIAPIKDMGDLIGANLKTIIPTIALGLLVVAIARHVRDKRELAAAKAQAS